MEFLEQIKKFYRYAEQNNIGPFCYFFHFTKFDKAAFSIFSLLLCGHPIRVVQVWRDCPLNPEKCGDNLWLTSYLLEYWFKWPLLSAEWHWFDTEKKFLSKQDLFQRTFQNLRSVGKIYCSESSYNTDVKIVLKHTLTKIFFKTFLTIKMCVFKESHWEEVQFDGYVGSKTNLSDSALIISKNLR